MSEKVPPLARAEYQDTIRAALAEDIGAGDVTTNATVDAAQRAQAVLVAKTRCVLAGLDVAAEAFRQRDAQVEIVRLREDGDWCEPGTVVARFRGTAEGLLTAERVALNFLQRLSGTATLSRQFAEQAGGRITVLDTRKTTPLLACWRSTPCVWAGPPTTAFGLDDGVLIKDNHVRLAGGVEAAVARARAAQSRFPIEVEAQSLEQVDAALRAGADIILLDNLPLEEVREAVARCHGRARTEISGVSRWPACPTWPRRRRRSSRPAP